MVHPVAEDDPPPASFTHLREVWHELCDPEATPETKLRSVFDREVDELDLPVAFLSRIDREADREHFEVVVGQGLPIVEGETVPLSESYCRRTIETTDGTLAVSDAHAEGWGEDPAYDRFGFGSYLGATVDYDDELHGTLCFARREPRHEPLADTEVSLVGMLAEWVGYEIAVREGAWTETGPTPGTRADAAPARGAGTDASLWSSEVDDVMDALARRPRRIILAGLLEGWVDTQADVLDAAGWDAGEVTTLEHNHLPRLDDAGFIEWDRETGAIDRGVAFDDLEATLQCVVDAVEEVDEVHR